MRRSLAVLACLSFALTGCASGGGGASPSATVTEPSATPTYETPTPTLTTESPTPLVTPTLSPAEAYYAEASAKALTDESPYWTESITYATDRCDPIMDSSCTDTYSSGSTEEFVAWGQDVCKVLKIGGVPQYPDDNKPGMLPAEFLREDLGVGDPDPLEPKNAGLAVLAVKYLCPKYAKYVTQAKSGKYPKFGPMTAFTDGDFNVGTEIKAGKYRTEPDQSDCYWERTTKDGHIIANNFVTHSAGRITVTIRSSDGSFSTNGCGTWTRVG